MTKTHFIKIFLFSIFLFPIKISFASQFAPPILRDTSGPEKEYKINRDEFLEKYEKDDSSRALINYYFSKRIPAKILLFSTLWKIPLLPFPLAGNIRVTQSASSSFSEGLGALMALIILGALLFTGIGLGLAGIGQWIQHSRQRLLKQLNDYSNTRSIPKSIYKSYMFKHVVKNGR